MTSSNNYDFLRVYWVLGITLTTLQTLINISTTVTLGGPYIRVPIIIRWTLSACPVLQMRKLKSKEVTCPRWLSYLMAEPGLHLKIDCSYKPLLWNLSANDGICTHIASLIQCISRNGSQSVIFFLIGQTLLTWKKSTNVKHSLSIYSKQSTVCAEGLIPGFNKEIVF